MLHCAKHDWKSTAAQTHFWLSHVVEQYPKHIGKRTIPATHNLFLAVVVVVAGEQMTLTWQDKAAGLHDKTVGIVCGS